MIIFLNNLNFYCKFIFFLKKLFIFKNDGRNQYKG